MTDIICVIDYISDKMQTDCIAVSTWCIVESDMNTENFNPWMRFSNSTMACNFDDMKHWDYFWLIQKTAETIFVLANT